MRNKVRKLRHWKQRWDPGAEFVWRRALTWQGTKVEVGSPVPKDMPKTKLRRFWESGIIELAQFEDPNVLTGLVDRSPSEPEQPTDEPLEYPGSETEQQQQPVEAPEVYKIADRKWFVKGLEEEAGQFSSKTAAQEAADEFVRSAAKAEAAAKSSEDDDWLETGAPE